MTQLVQARGGEPVTTSLVIAEQTDNQHKNVLELVRRYAADFETFGTVAFETRPFETAGGTQKREVAILNEPQTTLLMTYLRNTERVRLFKKAVVAEFYRMRQELNNPLARPELVDRAMLAQMVLDSERELQAAKAQAELDAPKIAYHERFIAETDDVMTIEFFASAWGTTEPKVRQALLDNGVAVRRCIGERWSASKRRMVKVYEWRPRQGTRYAEWFKVLPQHNAPRHHNGQVRQTMYLFSFHSEDLAKKLGLSQPTMFAGGDVA